MRALAYGVSVLATFVFLACGDDDSGTSTPPGPDGGASSSSGSSSSSSGTTSSSSGAATSSSSSSSGATGTAAQEKVYCDAVASRKTGCGKGDGVCDETAKCIYARVMKPEATTAYAECFGAPSCKSDDACVSEAGTKIGGAAATSYTSACQTKRTECGTAFTADFCDPAAYAYPGVGEAVTACLAKACADIKACLLAAYAPIQACK